MSSEIDHVGCPACAARLERYVEQLTSVYAGAARYRIDRCQACGCGVTLPKPTPDELAATYEGSYDYDAHSLIASEKKWRARRILDQLWDEPVASLLDVGCMYGFLLDEAQRRGVARVEGVELSEAPVRAARERGLKVFQGTLEKYAATGPGSFDVIVAQHVLEHVFDLDAFLRTAFALLRPGGRLLLCVPHFGSRTQRWFKRSWGWYQIPVHLFHFSKDALRALGDRHGAQMQVLRLRGGDSLFVLLTLFYALTTPSPGASKMTPLKRAVIGVANRLLRPYYYLGDEEILAIFRNAKPAGMLAAASSTVEAGAVEGSAS